MAKKPRSDWLDWAVCLAVRAAVAVIQTVPPSWARAFADLLAAVAHRVDRRHREVARENLLHAFPELRHDPDRLAAIVRGVYRHFLGLAVEIALTPKTFHVNNWHRKLRLAGGHLTLGSLTSGRPVLIVTGHFGNWELAGYVLGAFGFKTYAIARTLDNPYLEKFFKRFRQGTGQTILAKKGDFDDIEAVLAGGGAVATLADQDAGRRGVFVDFFGRPASTHKAVALMALEYNVPMLVVGVPRVGPGAFYEIVAEELIQPEDYDGDPEAVKKITQRYTAALERLVRRHPEQYFWLHRRWKSEPPRRKARAAA